MAHLQKKFHSEWTWANSLSCTYSVSFARTKREGNLPTVHPGGSYVFNRESHDSLSLIMHFHAFFEGFQKLSFSWLFMASPCFSLVSLWGPRKAVVAALHFCGHHLCWLAWSCGAYESQGSDQGKHLMEGRRVDWAWDRNQGLGNIAWDWDMKFGGWNWDGGRLAPPWDHAGVKRWNRRSINALCVYDWGCSYFPRPKRDARKLRLYRSMWQCLGGSDRVYLLFARGSIRI